MRLTEGLVSVLKEQRPDYIPVLLSGYREHGVFHTQVRPDLKTSISSEAKATCVAAFTAGFITQPRLMFGTSERDQFI